MSAALAPVLVDRCRASISSRLGLAFDDRSLVYLVETLQGRLATLGIGLAEYAERLEQADDREELGALAETLTVPETYFFRNVEQFHALRERALPECIEHARGRPLRLLSAGCASGEEPYSLAMVLCESTGTLGRGFVLRALDVNPKVLERAKRARYSPWSLRETPADVQKRWFKTNGRELALDDAIRASVEFSQGNLAGDDGALLPACFYDIVFCRNVLMYFTLEKYREAVARLAHAIVPGGFLFVGHAETLRGMSHDFELCHSHGTFYYRRKQGTALPIDRAAAPAPSPGAPTASGSAAWMQEIETATARVAALAALPSRAEGPAPASPAPQRLDLPLELLRSERYSEALDLVHALPSEAASDPDALLLEAVLLAQRGRFAEAEAACKRLLVLDEWSAGAHYVLALCEESRAATDRAVHHDQVAAYLDPAFAMPHVHLGLLFRRSGDREAARRELVKASALLEHEEAARLLLFGGGFGRRALLELCRAELGRVGGPE